MGSIPKMRPKVMKCKKHPKYKGMRKPTIPNGDFVKAADNGCICWAVWRKTQHVRRGDIIRIQGYAKGDKGKLAKVIKRDGDYVLVKRFDNKVVIDLLSVECKKVFRNKLL